MNNLKFRAWNGNSMENNIVVGELGTFYVQGLDPKDAGSLSPLNTIYSKSTPVMQYTGLKDKNGKEIYEGDILENHESGFIGVISWEEWLNEVSWGEYAPDITLGFRFKPTGRISDSPDGLSSSDSEVSEVIGNIYQDKHLL